MRLIWSVYTATILLGERIMKRHLVLAALIFVNTAVMGPNAHAQQDAENQAEIQGTGFYVGGHLGVNTADPEVNGGDLATDSNTLIGFGGALGYDFGNFRVDGELAGRFNTADSLGGISLDPESFDGSNNSTTFAFSYMVNGYFDIPTGGPLKPYVGGGIGFATVSIDWIAPGFIPFSQVPVADDSDSGFAYQFSGGIGYEINPKFTLSFSYRYFATEELQMVFSGASPINAGLPFTLKYQSHEFNVGVRVLFN
jgi:opacity protein-like surface antigen